MNRLTADQHNGIQIEQQPRSRAGTVPDSSLPRWQAIAAAVADVYRVILTRRPSASERRMQNRRDEINVGTVRVSDVRIASIGRRESCRSPAGGEVADQQLCAQFRAHRVRLDRAHRDLESHRPGETTVDAVAIAWGFGPLPFETAYAARYGRSPDATLRGPAFA